MFSLNSRVSVLYEPLAQPLDERCSTNSWPCGTFASARAFEPSSARTSLPSSRCFVRARESERSPDRNCREQLRLPNGNRRMKNGQMMQYDSLRSRLYMRFFAENWKYIAMLVIKKLVPRGTRARMEKKLGPKPTARHSLAGPKARLGRRHRNSSFQCVIKIQAIRIHIFLFTIPVVKKGSSTHLRSGRYRQASAPEEWPHGSVKCSVMTRRTTKKYSGAPAGIRVFLRPCLSFDVGRRARSGALRRPHRPQRRDLRLRPHRRRGSP